MEKIQIPLQNSRPKLGIQTHYIITAFILLIRHIFVIWLQQVLYAVSFYTAFYVINLNTVLKSILMSTVLFTLLAGTSRTTVKAVDESMEYMEYILISVNCTDASLTLMCQLISENETLIHYPSEVNIEDPHLTECLSIIAMFNTTGSLLAFSFNGTNTVTAKNNADAMKPSIDTAFGLTFTYLNTTAFAGPPPYVVVAYTAGGVGDIASFTGTLKADCLASDIGGFSNVLETLVAQSADLTVTLLAYNMTEKWAYTLMTMYETTIPTGLDSHTTDVLDLLGAGALEPSPYAEVEGVYLYSGVQVVVNCDTDVTFVSCVPDETTTPFTRGWYVSSYEPTTLYGGFYFGSDPTLVEALNFTFGGQVIPEFSIFTFLFTLSAIGSAILLLKKRSALH